MKQHIFCGLLVLLLQVNSWVSASEGGAERLYDDLFSQYNKEIIPLSHDHSDGDHHGHLGKFFTKRFFVTS